VNNLYFLKTTKYVSFFIVIFIMYFCLSLYVYATETYSPGESIVIGEFIYNDDYTPTTDDCTVSIFLPNNVVDVDEVVMNVETNGWHYYQYTIPATEGKYPTFISCGSVLTGDLLKIDKTFIVKNYAFEDDISEIKSKTDTIIWSDVSLIKAKTDTIAWNDVTSITTKTDTIDWIDIDGIVTTTGDIKAKTDTIDWTDISAILTDTGSIAWADVTSIKTKTDTITWADIDGLGLTATAIKAKTDTINWSDIVDIPLNVWTYTTRGLTTFGSLVADVWSNATRTLTGLGGTIESDIAAIKAKTDTIAWNDVTSISTKTDTINWADIDGIVTTTGDIKTKTDTINWSDITAILSDTDTIAWADVTGIKTKTDTIVWGDVDTIKTNVATLITEIGTGNISGIKTKTDIIDWADITGLVTSNGDIKAKTDTIAWADVTAILTDTDTIAWSDVIGIKSKTDTIAWADIDGLGLTATAIKAKTDTINWSDIVDIPLNVWTYTTRTLSSFGTLVSEIWNYSTRSLTTSSPPQVIITSMANLEIPNIEANVTITNEGYTGFEYQYEWCVVSSIDNSCGGGDDIDYGSAAKFISSGEDFNTVLSSVVPTAGNYYFKVNVFYGLEKSGASRSFIATTAGGGGGGGGGGGISTPPVIDNNVCRGADFNKDNIVNSVDFSILLSFWKSFPPFVNPCVDINKDNTVNSIDFSILLSQWGSSGIIFNN
jgi:hypothetical protein